jgi:uncharacterized protein (TIGR03083 family)
MPVMEIDEYIATLERQGFMLADAAHGAGLDAVVPTCPGWRMRDLLRHIGYVHRWAAGYVAGQLTEQVPELTEAEQLAAGPADDKLARWFECGLTDLAEALGNADPGIAAWTFLEAPSPRAFWARRQAHETAIHCADAKLAAGHGHAYPAEFAADGIDELLIGFFGRDAARSVAASHRGRVLLVRAADVGQDWHVRLDVGSTHVIATGRGTCQDGSVADCTLTGSASDLYALLWNRATLALDAQVSGEARLLAGWVSNMRVTWA